MTYCQWVEVPAVIIGAEGEVGVTELLKGASDHGQPFVIGTPDGARVSARVGQRGLCEQVDGVDAVGHPGCVQQGLAVISDAALVLGGAEPEEDIDLQPLVAAMLGELLGVAIPAQRLVGRQLVQGTGPRRGCVAHRLGILGRSGGCHPVAG